MRRLDEAGIADLRRYAASGLSLREAARLLDMPIKAVLNKAVDLRIAFVGPPGGPFPLVRRGFVAPQEQREDTTVIQLPRRAGVCRACGLSVDDTLLHYRQVHQRR